MSHSRSLTVVRVNTIILSLFLMFYGLVELAEQLTSVLMLLGGVFILTYLFLGPVNGVENFMGRYRPLSKGTRIVSVLIVYLTFGLMLGLFTYGVLPALFAQVRSFAGDLPEYLKKINTQLSAVHQAEWYREKTLIQKLNDWTQHGNPSREIEQKGQRIEPETPGESKTESPQTIIVVVDDVESAQQEIRKAVNQTGGATLKGSAIGEATMVLTRYTSNVMGYLVDFGKSTVASVIYALTALVLVFYLLVDGTVLREGFVQLLPAAMRAGANDYLEEVHSVLYYFIHGQVILAVIAGVGMWLVCVWFDVEYAFLLSVVFGVASVIPVIGPWFGIIPVTLVAALAGGAISVWPAWAAVLMYAGMYYLVKTYWLIPRWFENRLEIHPVVLILSFLACMKSANLLGVLMAYPLASILAGTYWYLAKRMATEKTSA